MQCVPAPYIFQTFLRPRLDNNEELALPALELWKIADRFAEVTNVAWGTMETGEPKKMY